MAASFLIALVVGMGLRGNYYWSGGLAHSLDSPLRPAIAEVPLNKPGALQVAATTVRPADNWETLTLSADGQSGTFRVPAVHRDTLDENLLESFPAAVPPELQQMLERSGHRVVQQRQIVPVNMQDGSRAVFPVDHVEIHFVGRPSL